MVTATEKLYSDSSAFTFAGTWSTDTNAGWSGGSANKSSTIGDSVTINWTGRSLYLFTAQASYLADLQVTTDGAQRSALRSGVATPFGTVYRAPICIERNLADGAHTTVLRSVTTGTNTQIFINSVVVVSGSRATATTGNYSACGDSWSVGSGAAVPSAGYTDKVSRRMSAWLGRDIALTKRGISGAGLANKPATNSTNAIQQVAAAVTANVPEMMTMLFGVNDLATTNSFAAQTPGLFAENWRTTLQFVEDVFDTSSVKIAAGTPGYVSPAYRWGMRQNAGTIFTGAGGGDTYELGVNAARSVFAEFAWLAVADVYAAMDRRTLLVYPNANADLGLHPNEQGHSVVADELVHALLGGA